MQSVTDLTRKTWGGFKERIGSLRADSPRQWGTMTAAEMCRHMTLSIQGGLGEIPIQDRGNFATRLLMPVLFSGLIPFPKGRAKTAPEYVARDAGEFESERDALTAAAERFLDWCDSNPAGAAQHPFFGMLTMQRWQRGHALHLEHHLKQFGV